MPNVLIIGSGMAAIAAAAEAKRQGAEVTILAGHPGATALSSGAWDVAGNPLRHPSDAWNEVPSPLQNLQALIQRNPYHPYALIQESVGDIAAFLHQTIENLSQALAYRLVGSMQSSCLTLTPAGTLKATAYVPKSCSAGNFLEMAGARLLIVGFKGLAGGSAKTAAKFLQNKMAGVLAAVEAVELFPGQEFASPFELAHKLDDAPLQNDLYQALQQATEKHRPTHVALPPVIGLEQTAQILSRLQEATGVPCFETLSLPPSVPGLRLQNALHRYRQVHFQVMSGRACGVASSGDRMTHVDTIHEDQTKRIAVDRVVLATGKYLGGGIVKETCFEEPVAHLPLFLQGQRIEKVFVGKVTERPFLSDHPFFSVGVMTNPTLQPVNEQRQVIYQNLWAAGSLLTGSNPAVDHSGMGTAIATGTLAGRFASERLASGRLASC